tara:strand:+ start:9896 stop:10501 length:606 start_codon:yes stop_codon:yes gene_type:complete
MLKEHDVCTLAGCDRPHKARGYCQTHYMQFKRGITPVGPIRTRVREKPVECVEDGCSEPVKSKGLCKMHYQRFLRHGHTMYRNRKKPAKQCVISDCDSVLYAKSLCHAHYIKQRKWQAAGVDATRYQEMLREQGGVCAICSQPERTADGLSGKPKDLAVDHDHATGAVRALLCSACNTAIGLFNDDVALLAKAQSYVLYHR